MSIILRAINDNGVKYDLDLFQNEDLRLDISAIESGDIGQVFGISSQRFSLPSTPKNDEFFGNLYDLGASPNVAFTKTSPCQVLYNGAEVFTGKLYLDSIITDHQGDNLYNLHVVNEVVDFKFQIQDLFLSDLDWSEYDHTLTMTNITSSWDNNLFGGDIKYPLVNYGIDPNDSLATAIEGGGDPGQFDNSSTPLRPVDFRPAIKAKAVVDKIFDSVNYTYSSSFFDSAYFNNLYILATEGEGGNQFASPTTSSLRSLVGSTQNLTNNTPAIIDFATEVFDNAGAWVTNTYTAPVDGQYSFYAQLNFGQITGTRPSVEDLYLEWWDPIGAAVYNGGQANTIIDLTNSQGPQVFIGPTTITLQAGDQVQLRAVVDTTAGASNTYPIVTGKIEVDGAPTLTGGDVNMAYVWGEDTKIIDFLDGLIQKFNLVFEPKTLERNIIEVESFDTWVDAGEQKDWSDKVDYNVKWEIVHPLQQQPKDLIFTDLQDTDSVNAYHESRTGNIYGQYNYNSDSELTIGEKTIGAFFSPTPMKGIDGAPTMILPALAQREEGQLVPYKFNPRILYDVGMVSCSVDVYGIDDTTGNAVIGNYWVLNDDSSVERKGEYPLFHHLNLGVDGYGRLEDATDSTRDLHFGNTINPGHWSYHQKQVNAYTKQSAFYQYWAFYVNELYDLDSRKVTLNIKLDPSEIQDIKLNDKIFIDGHYYRIDKITGANLLREDSIQVTLLKTSPRKLKFPRRRIYLDDGTATDVTIDDASLNQSGQGVVYNDFNTGLPVSGSVAEIAASRDGLSSYNGGDNIIWKTQPPQQYTLTSADNFGNNEVRTSANKVNVTGENNVIRDNVSKVNVVGEGNRVSEYTQYSSVSGQQNSLGLRTKNATILGSLTSSITQDTELATIIGGENTIISGSNQSVTIGQNTITQGGNSNIVVGNTDSTTKTISDVINAVVINPNRDVDSILTTGEDFNGHAFVGTYKEIGGHFSDSKTITAYAGQTLYLTGSEYANDSVYNLTWSGSDGISQIYLPAVDASPSAGTLRDSQGFKRLLRFNTDGTFDAGKNAGINVAAGDYLNGNFNGSYTLDEAYQNFEIYGIEDTKWRVLEAGVPDITNGGHAGAYGSFYSTADQAIATSGSAQLVTLNNTQASNKIALSGSGAIQMEYNGAYHFTYTATVTNNDNVIHYADFWVKYNGTDYPNSTTRASIPARKSAGVPSSRPVTVNLLDVAVNDGDVIELYWRGDSTLLSLNYETFGGTIPAAPSVRATIEAV